MRDRESEGKAEQGERTIVVPMPSGCIFRHFRQSLVTKVLTVFDSVCPNLPGTYIPNKYLYTHTHTHTYTHTQTLGEREYVCIVVCNWLWNFVDSSALCVCRDFLLSFPAGTFSLDWHIFAVNLQENQYLYTICLCYIVSQQWFSLVARGFAVS